LPDDNFLVAEKEGVLIGFCHFRLRGKTCFIAGLGVLPQYREHGVGSQLMAEALYRADTEGAQTTYLKVRSLNQAAKLYASFGFFEKQYGDTLTLVRKRMS
jgi:[ribosomal protein S18]-alanine N-acetyltransferase